MPRHNSDTRSEILAVAAELFAERGYEQTSLREIAERLAITKAALYYHFTAKRELLSSLVAPLLQELRELGDDVEGRGEHVSRDPRPVVEAYFALCVRHRLVLRSLVRDAQTLHEVEIVSPMSHWRERIDALLVGSTAAADRVRAVIALGGLQDTVVLFDEGDLASAHDAAIEAAMRALLPGWLRPDGFARMASRSSAAADGQAGAGWPHGLRRAVLGCVGLCWAVTTVGSAHE